MTARISESSFNPWDEIQRYQSKLSLQNKYGATAVFIGSMRDFNEGDDVHSMTLEHYPGMTDKYLEKITQEASKKWDVLDCLVVHRVGVIQPNEPIVLVAVWSAHRAAAYDANRYIMEELKSHAPFWKKEQLADGSRWVEKNTSG